MKVNRQTYIPNSLGAKLVCNDNRFVLPAIIFEGKNCINEFLLNGFLCSKKDLI